jgi:hypothetical protein
MAARRKTICKELQPAADRGFMKRPMSPQQDAARIIRNDESPAAPERLTAGSGSDFVFVT